ncbi:hypothetical protein [Parasitella parasitica]|uniref:Uncharacterized protein n=1 Tax=Parasitella parasitica TaxID=35722 RepID=A0A0B7MQE2_9FUNG|nr:hypothetical protein [Parasitella parasitica]
MPITDSNTSFLSNQQEQTKQDETYVISKDHEYEDDMSTQEIFPVQVDRLAQIIATHLQFDHLDAVISSTDKEIATEFQHHIQINVESNNDDANNDESELMSHNANQQYAIQQQLPTLDMMDLEILKSQIFAAIQAHTEGNLPLTWDKLAEGLSRQSIESYLRNALLQACGQPDQDTISSSCLQQHAIKLATDLDKYITDGLAHVFHLLDQEALPDLLQHTAKDLKGILNYFNSAFLRDGHRKFVLQVVPWNSDPTDVHSFQSRLLEMAVHPLINDGTEESHSTAFFIEYAAMARV